MTGFGRAEVEDDATSLTVEIRTVNHRYLEIFVHLPDEVPRVIEKVLRDNVSDVLNRGRVDVYVDFRQQQQGQSVSVDRNLVRQYHKSLKDIAAEHDLDLSLSVSDIAGLPGVIQVEESDLEACHLEDLFDQVVCDALKQVIKSRKQEGGQLANSILGMMDEFESELSCLKKNIPAVEKKRHDRIIEKLDRLLHEEDLTSEHLDVSGEAALAVQKSSVVEELDRLDSHLARLREVLTEGGVVGRKLQFVMQEMWREVNTVAAKIADVQLSEMALQMKNLLEDMREQVRNIE